MNIQRKLLSKQTYAPAPLNQAKESRECSSCHAKSAKLSTCAKCKRAWYCGKDCQTQHWKSGHKEECRLYCEAVKRTFERDRAILELEAQGRCVICTDDLNLHRHVLKCGHAYHPLCIEGLKSLGVESVCPRCVTERHLSPPPPSRARAFILILLNS